MELHKIMHPSSTSLYGDSCNINPSPKDWHYWCRLCAKDDMNSGNIISSDEMESTIVKAIEKYFCVQMKPGIPQLICTKCKSFISTLIDFEELVVKAQDMFAFLQNVEYSRAVDFQCIRLKYGFSKEDPLSEVKYCTEKVDQASDICIPNFEVKFKEEYLSDCSQADEVTCEYADDVTEGEDPFDTDSNKSTESKILKLKENTSNNKDNRKPEKNIRSQGKSTDSKYICDNCPLHFQRLGNYRIHMKKMHGKTLEPLTCSECPKSFKNRYDLNRHIKKHRPLSEKRIFPCPQCDRKFQTKDYVAKHIQFVHEDIRPFICEECGEGTRTETTLREHMLTHTDLAPFECEVCKKSFKNQSRLKNHMEIHSAKKHICGECGLKLNSRITLNRHMLVHSDMMRHKCDYCGRGFKRAKTLKNHLILHSGLKPYSCEFCDKNFTNGSNCRTHMKRVHPRELAELEASGKKISAKNIPRLALLKSIVRVSDNLNHVVSKQSGNFASGKKCNSLSDHSVNKKRSEIQI